MNYAKKSTSSNKISKRLKKRALPTPAALVLVAFTLSSLDTTHSFSESFSRGPQHLTPSPTFSPLLSGRTKSSRILSNPSTLFPHIDPATRSREQYHQPPRTVSSALFYAPNPDTSKTAPMVAQAFYSSHKSNRNPTKPKWHTSPSSSTLNSTFPPLSNSVLSSSDTLPSFPTAHGLLSPETVLRMENRMKMQQGGGEEMVQFRTVNMFLDRYKKEGPMACLPFLSDEEVLPRLTEAMRDIL
mmetsp:Transcript_20903/g.30908  ORF Transcript_20903/g.30908 Transcript_20903/m.30908 type:complete len:242 (-) Transcript_20903:238-963(-)